MKTTKPKTRKSAQAKHPLQRPLKHRLQGLHSKKRQLVHTIRKSRRREYPLHKRLMLHPLSMFVFLCTGVFMAGWTYHVVAATVISSTVEAPALLAGATIATPTTGASFASSPTHVTGSCPPRSYVALHVNGAFNGVGWCGTNNTYSITTSLHSGTNTLAVQDYNETDLQGPASDSVQVVYTPKVAALSYSANSAVNSTAQTNISGSQSAVTKSSTPPDQASTAAATPTAAPIPLLLTSDFQFHTFAVQKAFSWDLDLEGGSPPYDVNINWGDGTTGHMRFPGDPVFTLHHVFQSDGYYAVVVNSTDTAGQQHVMQLAALITKKDGTSGFLGTPSSGNTSSSDATTTGSSSTSSSGSSSNPVGSLAGTRANAKHLLVVAWPSYIIVALMTVSFWLGEKREINLIVAQPRHRYRH